MIKYEVRDKQVNGIDTIQELRGSMPKEIKIPFDLAYKQQMLQQGWNQCYAAVIMYCFKCKEPLVWHTYPAKVLFHCSKCGAKWVKGEDWKDGKAVRP